MFKKLLCPFVITIFLISCNSQDAFKYSQDFVREEERLVPIMEAGEIKIAALIEAQKFKDIAAPASEVEKKIGEVISKYQQQPAPKAKGGEAFKKAGIDYFGYFKKLYAKYREYGDAVDDTARNVELNEMIELIGKKDAAVRAIQIAQKDYASANGFRIEK